MRSILWPSGLDEQENLIVAHDRFFVEAMIEAQRWVDCQQYNNTQLFRACSRFYKCGLNVMEQPVSQEPIRSIANTIRRVSVIDKIDPVTKLESATAPDDWCSQIYYDQVDYCKIVAYQKKVAGCSSCGGFADFSGLFGYLPNDCKKGNYPTPDDAEYLAYSGLPLGHHYQPQESTNSICRARRGVWALERGRLYIAPWLQSTETVIVEWDGIKNLWDDLDLVENNAQLKRFVRYYVQWNHLKDYDRDDVAAKSAEKDWRTALSELMRDCREETRVRGCEGSNARMAVIPLQSQGGPTGQLFPEPATIQLAIQEATQCPFVAPPSFDPPSGSIVTFPVWIVISCATPGAEIFYTLNGSSTPSRASTKYNGPFQIGANTNVKAVAYVGQCGSILHPGGVVESDYIDAALITDSPPTLSTLCTDIDKAGKWFVFHPDGSKDINWKLLFKFIEAETVTRLELYETNTAGEWTTGRCWATQYTIYPPSRGGSPFNSYPLVITENNLQRNTQYESSLGSVDSSLHDWRLFGESVGSTSTGKFYKLIIFRADGLVIYATSNITCNENGTCFTIDGSSNPESGSFTMTLGGSLEAGGVQLTFTFDENSGRWVFSNLKGGTLNSGSDVVGTTYPAPLLAFPPINVTWKDGYAEVCATLPSAPATTTTTTVEPTCDQFVADLPATFEAEWTLINGICEWTGNLVTLNKIMVDGVFQSYSGISSDVNGTPGGCGLLSAAIDLSFTCNPETGESSWQASVVYNSGAVVVFNGPSSSDSPVGPSGTYSYVSGIFTDATLVIH